MNGFPLSKVSKDARYTLSLSIKSANLFNSLPRSDASIVRHGDPRRKAYYVIDIQNDKSFGFLINNIRISQDKRKNSFSISPLLQLLLLCLHQPYLLLEHGK